MAEANTTDAQESPQTPETPAAPASDPNPADGAPAPSQDGVKPVQSDPGTIDAAKPEEGADPPAKAKDEPAEKADEKGSLQRLRETIAGGDEKVLKELERYKSAESLAKALREARVTARNAGKPVRLPENASEDDIKAFRESMGIPEDAADYPVSFREGYEASEADTEVLGDFRAAMHEGNVDPKAAEVALEWYQDYAIASEQERSARLAGVAKETQSALRSEWGGEYDGNLGAVREFMTAQLGEDGFQEMMEVRLEDGARLQDHLPFVKMMAQVATDYYGSNAIYNGDIETTSKTVQERIDELMALRGGSKEDQDKYWSDGVQSEITKLYAQRDKINARKG